MCKTCISGWCNAVEVAKGSRRGGKWGGEGAQWVGEVSLLALRSPRLASPNTSNIVLVRSHAVACKYAAVFHSTHFVQLLRRGMLAGSAAAYEELLIFLAHLAAETKTLTNRLTSTHTYAHTHARTQRNSCRTFRRICSSKFSRSFLFVVFLIIFCFWTLDEFRFLYFSFDFLSLLRDERADKTQLALLRDCAAAIDADVGSGGGGNCGGDASLCLRCAADEWNLMSARD